MFYINRATGKVVGIGGAQCGVRYLELSGVIQLEREQRDAEAFGNNFVNTVRLQDNSDPLVGRIFRNC